MSNHTDEIYTKRTRWFGVRRPQWRDGEARVVITATEVMVRLIKNDEAGRAREKTVQDFKNTLRDEPRWSVDRHARFFAEILMLSPKRVMELLS